MNCMIWRRTQKCSFDIISPRIIIWNSKKRNTSSSPGAWPSPWPWERLGYTNGTRTCWLSGLRPRFWAEPRDSNEAVGGLPSWPYLRLAIWWVEDSWRPCPLHEGHAWTSACDVPEWIWPWKSYHRLDMLEILQWSPLGPFWLLWRTEWGLSLGLLCWPFFYVLLVVFGHDYSLAFWIDWVSILLEILTAFFELLFSWLDFQRNKGFVWVLESQIFDYFGLW